MKFNKIEKLDPAAREAEYRKAMEEKFPSELRERLDEFAFVAGRVGAPELGDSNPEAGTHAALGYLDKSAFDAVEIPISDKPGLARILGFV